MDFYVSFRYDKFVLEKTLSGHRKSTDITGKGF